VAIPIEAKIRHFFPIFVSKFTAIMTALQKAEALLPQLSLVEKAQLVQKVAGSFSSEFPGIEKTPGVCGGVACIIRTRIPVRTLVTFKKMGLPDQKLLANYPTLRHQDLSNAWAYYLAFKEEIELEIRENEEA
jgi:uncharacterized protein (DUF433 family)